MLLRGARVSGYHTAMRINAVRRGTDVISTYNNNEYGRGYITNPPSQTVLTMANIRIYVVYWLRSQAPLWHVCMYVR